MILNQHHEVMMIQMVLNIFKVRDFPRASVQNHHQVKENLRNFNRLRERDECAFGKATGHPAIIRRATASASAMNNSAKGVG